MIIKKEFTLIQNIVRQDQKPSNVIYNGRHSCKQTGKKDIYVINKHLTANKSMVLYMFKNKRCTKILKFISQGHKREV